MDADELMPIAEIIRLWTDIALVVVDHKPCRLADRLLLRDRIVLLHPVVEQGMQIEIQRCAQCLLRAYLELQRDIPATLDRLALRIRDIRLRHGAVALEIFGRAGLRAEADERILAQLHCLARRQSAFGELTADMDLEAARRHLITGNGLSEVHDDF